MKYLFSFSSCLFLFNACYSYPYVHQHPSRFPLASAVQTGIDTNGNRLYLCLANLFNSMQPGKTWAGYGHCNVPYGGREYIVDHFTIPERRELGHYFWDRDNEAVHAIIFGNDTNGNELYVCQAHFNGSLQPGKSWPGYYHCNISYGGREIVTNNYQVLSRVNEIIVPSHPQPTLHYHN